MYFNISQKLWIIRDTPHREFASDTKYCPAPTTVAALGLDHSWRWSMQSQRDEVCARALRGGREIGRKREGLQPQRGSSQDRARVRSSDTRIDLRAATEGHTLHQSLRLSRLSSHSRRCQRPRRQCGRAHPRESTDAGTNKRPLSRKVFRDHFCIRFLFFGCSHII